MVQKKNRGNKNNEMNQNGKKPKRISGLYRL
jgi:hypothetical protein